MNHLTDRELINYTIKHSTDPEKIRLATYMERVEGSIIDDLVDAGMDDTWCTFTSEYGGNYHPGQYIKFLESELQDRDFKIEQLHKELDERKTLTVADLIQEMNQEIRTQQFMIKEATAEAHRAKDERNLAKDKLSMWAKLNGQV
jgi:hypothetical protein